MVKFCIAILLCFALISCKSVPQRETLDTYLSNGRITDGLKAYESSNRDPQAEFERGVLLVVDALSKFSWELASYVKRDRRQQEAPFLSSRSQPVTYQRLRSMLSRLRDNLREASVHLELGGSGSWKSVVRPLMIRVDLNEDGSVSASEGIGEVATFGLQRALRRADPLQPERFEIAADAADSLWLAGYCQLVPAVLDIILVYDWSGLYQAFAGEIFENVEDKSAAQVNIYASVVTVSDRQLGESARRGFLKVLDLNEATMKALSLETDNDREWIPSATQTSVTTLSINEARWNEWKSFAQDFRLLLEGEAFLKQSISYQDRGLGLNVRKLFEDPIPLSLRMPPSLRNYLVAAPPEKIIDESRGLFRFLTGDGMLYAFFIN